MLTISHTVAEHLRALRIHELTDVVVVDLGPGQLQGVATAPVEDREPTILLVGDAPHKRNELAADLLSQIRALTTNWRVLGISLSDTTEARLRRSFPESRLSLHREVPQEAFVQLASAATVYLALGVSEGFGFPYIEAAYLGCDVIAVRQSLTLELFGELAVLLPSASPTACELAAALASWDRARVERLQARACARSWDTTAGQVAAVVRRALGD